MGDGEKNENENEGEKEEKEGEGEEKETKHPVLLELWHALQLFGDIVERVFNLILGDL
ncbi:hypothetical protein TWF506_006832 [Arthrobotrys conoides]|uniref:Uncharacterized protein n=1 Tax=Arthrobotrys conoides TaxID=74498 RepID=A0AAN8P4G5_9PEZI